ncbi:LacI family DNA-binding transcriptional regulator [bacterium]|nr:LacI family DNA-binding transcriptional regulator [bacterium]
MAVTIYDIAEKAGVGIGTVSRALNNSPHISLRTKEKVQAVITELGYQPHAMARGLAKQKTYTFAVIVPVFTGYFFMEVLRGVQQEVTKAHYDMILYSVDHSDKTDLFLKKVTREKRVDGALLISLGISDVQASACTRLRFPIVLVDSTHPSLDSITVQNRQGAERATSHLISLGHTKIGMIDAQLKSSPAQVRLEGYRDALKKHGLPLDEKYLIISDQIAGQHGFNRESGYLAMKQLLQLGSERPTAVFVSSDIQAAGAVRAISEEGLTIPEDVSLIGFDDIEIAEYLELTTMRQPMFQLGQLGVRRLLERIANPDLERFHRSFDTELVIRQSCGIVTSTN